MSNKYELTTTDKYGLGNIDLTNRPVVTNDDGSISTVRSMSFSDGVNEILVPTIVNGKLVSDDEAIQHYYDTGEYLGKFNSIEDADAYAEQLHKQQELLYRRLNMDNEAPNYASWVPEAGGYVANGKVVSKSPVYDEAGKFRLDVDASLFGGTTSQPTTAKAQPQVANNPLSNNGITTANTAGSGEDVNSMETKIGSMGSLNNNTENTIFGPTNTPATKSNIAEEPILSPVDEVMKELQESIARGNDFQEQINLYTKLGRLTGVDYSAEIADLTNKRQQKIENIDNDYSSQIATAMMRGDTEEVARLKAEQANWRNTVGYQDAMASKYEQARQEIDADYVPTFWAGIQDIAGMVAQALPGILNFQYDPTQDQNLLRAQSLIEMRARNRASQTGMYYSSTTQYAISQACANLIPIYQKMAKEEAIQNFQLLQQTANFLVNLEQTQFNLWKGQLDAQLQVNAEKRKEIEAAWDKVNQLGYVDNETSAILGIPAGTESYATRKAYVDRLNQIDSQNREFEQNIILSGYKQVLELEKMEKQSQLDREEYQQKAATDYIYDSQLAAEKHGYDIALENTKSQNNINEAWYKSMFGGEAAPTYEISYTDENGKEIKIKGTATKDELTGQWVDPLGNVVSSGGEQGDVWKSLAGTYGTGIAKTAKDLYDKNEVSKVDFSKVSNIENYSDTLKEAVARASSGLDSNQQGPVQTKNVNIVPYLEGIYSQKAAEVISENAKNYGSTEEDTRKAVENSTQTIINLLSDMQRNGATDTQLAGIGNAMFTELFDGIKESEEFDFPQQIRKSSDVIDVKGIANLGKLNIINQGVRAKQDAMVWIADEILSTTNTDTTRNIPSLLKQTLAKSLSSQIYDYANSEGGYMALKYADTYKYLDPEANKRKKTAEVPSSGVNYKISNDMIVPMASS